MSHFSGPTDIYEALVDNAPEDEEWLLSLVAFSVVEEQKIEWIRHYRENHDSMPTNEEIERWYRHQPEGVLLRAKDTATARLASYAQNTIATYAADYEKEVLENILVDEIRSTKKFWPQFGVNLAGGFASALLFAGLLALVAFFVLNDSSPRDIMSKISNHNEEVIHD